MRTEAGAAVLAVLLATLPAAAQPPAFEVRIEPLPPALGLAGAIDRARASRDVVWLGWSVPAAAGQGDACCFEGRFGDWRRRGCRLEGGKGGLNLFSDARDGAPAPTEIALLVRFAGGRPTEMHPVGLDCPLHFGGRALWWLESAGASESAALFAAWARSAGGDLDDSDLLLALSMQRDGLDHLIRLARDRALDRDLRREAVFWLGQSSDERAMEFLEATLLRPSPR